MIKIVQPLNNNVVMGYDRKKGEVVVVGTGIGFHAKKGDIVDENKIQKIFTAGKNRKLLDIIEKIPPEYLELAEEIFEKARKEYQVSAEEDMTLALVDHIHFAVKRLREGLELDNPFLMEIREFYKNEWKVGIYARDRIKQMFGVEIPESEVGYISMYLISSEYRQDRRAVSKVFQVIDISISYIRENYLTDVSEKSFAYNRLVTHVKFFAQRYIDNKENMENDEFLKKTIREVFEEEADCIRKLSEILHQKFGRYMTESEENYLVLHLRNCKNIGKNS